MITEDYVSFETAKLLKEKGFDGYCFAFHKEQDKYTTHPNSVHFAPTLINNECLLDASIIICPTLQMAMKWLREVHKIHISVEMGFDVDNHQYYFFVPSVCMFSDKSGEYETPFGEEEFDTYEEAAETVVKYCLENLI